jgi:hypothetical protein
LLNKFYKYIRTKASIPIRQIGHDRSEWPQGTHVARWPQGMQARRFSSSKHRTQRFDDDASFAWTFSGNIVFFVLISFFSSVFIIESSRFPSLATESDADDISTSVLFEEFVKEVAAAACSRARIAIILLKLTIC